MTYQFSIDFDTPPLARKKAAHYRLILSALECGPLGNDGIAARSRLTAYQVSKRLTELHRLGAIAPTGDKVQSTAGRAEREWRLVE